MDYIDGELKVARPAAVDVQTRTQEGIVNTKGKFLPFIDSLLVMKEKSRQMSRRRYFHYSGDEKWL